MYKFQITRQNTLIVQVLEAHLIWCPSAQAPVVCAPLKPLQITAEYKSIMCDKLRLRFAKA